MKDSLVANWISTYIQKCINLPPILPKKKYIRKERATNTLKVNMRQNHASEIPKTYDLK